MKSIAEHFHVSTTAAQLTITLFLLGYCAGPLIFAPLSEFYGRRRLYLVTFLLFTAFNFLCAFASNFGSLLVGRFLTGMFVSSALSNGPGVLADIWQPIERGVAMASFSVAVNIGPSMGPIAAGFLELTKDWRWSFYVILWMSGGMIVLLFTIPETLPSLLLLRKAEQFRGLGNPEYDSLKAPVEVSDRSLKGTMETALTRPWIILFDPISLLVAIYMSVIYALLYMLFTIFPIVYQQKRGWNAGVGELPLLASTIGPCFTGLTILLDARKKRRKMEQGYHHRPEDRMPLAMIGGVMFPLSMFWFAWTGEYNSVHWIVPIIAGVFLTFSITLIFVTCLNYLTDTYTVYAASAVAANTVARSAVGAAAPLFTQRMFDVLGVGGGGSLIAGVAVVLAIIPFAFYKYGKEIRSKSKFVIHQNQ